MKKSTKGALAATGAAALLIGGVGSLAYWSTSQGVAGGTFSTGSLNMTLVSCSSGSAWLYTTPSASPVTSVVPGDQIYKDCTYKIQATGDHIAAVLSAPASVSITASPSGGGTPSTWVASAGATYTLVGPSVTATPTGNPTLDGSANGATLTAHVLVTIPFGDPSATNANDTQQLTASVPSYNLTLTQTSTTANANP